MKVGYVRVSSKDQNEERQIKVLRDLGVEKVFTEKVSGKSRDRAELKKLMEFVREGDVVHIESISRIARNTLDFLEIVKELGEKGVELVSQKEMIDTSTPQGKFMLTVFGALYELERENIKQRQAEGIDVAKENGVRFGRPKKEITDDFKKVIAEWKAGSLTAVAAMKKMGMKPNTFYRRAKELEA